MDKQLMDFCYNEFKRYPKYVRKDGELSDDGYFLANAVYDNIIGEAAKANAGVINVITHEENNSVHKCIDVVLTDNSKEITIDIVFDGDSYFWGSVRMEGNGATIYDIHGKIISSLMFGRPRDVIERLLDTGKRLSNANLSNLDLSQFDFTNCSCDNANFNGSNLTGSDFRNADIRRAKFINAILDGANFTGAVLHDAKFDKDAPKHANGLPIYI